LLFFRQNIKIQSPLNLSFAVLTLKMRLSGAFDIHPICPRKQRKPVALDATMQTHRLHPRGALSPVVRVGTAGGFTGCNQIAVAKNITPRRKWKRAYPME